MKRLARPALTAGLLAGCLVACGDRDTGRLEAVWSGADSGRMTGPATAVWCKDTRLAQVTGVLGDTGIGILIHPAESLVAGVYPIVEPDSAQRTAPAGALALRLLAPTAVVGYRADSGSVTLERVGGGRIGGRFEARAKVVTALTGTIRLRGRFRGVPVGPGSGGCAR